MQPSAARLPTFDTAVTVEGVGDIFALVLPWHTTAIVGIVCTGGGPPFATTTAGKDPTGPSLLPCAYVSDVARSYLA